MTAVIGATMFYIATVVGTTLPEHTVPMDSPEACQRALQSFKAGPFVKGIEAAGGTVVAGCR
jgi:hypothetical protein